MSEHRSKLESMARTLTRVAIVLLVLFVGAVIGAIQYVDSELDGEATLFRYLLVIATAGPLLASAVITWVGACVIRAIGRVRGSLLDAMLSEVNEPEPPPPELSRVGR